MSVVSNTLLLTGDDGYQISRSVRLRSSASAYLNRTLTTPTNNKIFTWSGWVKRGVLSGYPVILGAGQTSGSTNYFIFYFNTTDGSLVVSDVIGGSQVCSLNTSSFYRDPSAWYHIIYSVDTTQATASNRAKLYVNGVQVTAFAGASYYALNAASSANVSGYVMTLGAQYINGSASNHLDGYLTEVNFIDGQALTPSSFGETDAVTGVWKPKKYAGTYGTNGFYLNFSDNSAATAAAIGKDNSGNGNNWTPNNISVTSGVTYDSMIDTPTMYADGGNGRGNYPVLNPLYNTGTLGYLPLTNANLTATDSSGSAAWRSRWATMQLPTTGKWYCEFPITYAGSASVSSAGAIGIGLHDGGSATYVGQTSTTYGYFSSALKANNASSSAYGATYANGDIIGVAYDADAGTLTFYKNNTSQGVAYSSIPVGTYFFAVSAFWVSPDGNTTINANFGQRPFTYTPPTGFKALNTQNLPDATIKKGNAYFDATLYTGNGTSQSIVNSGGFQPDLVWAKQRNGAANHRQIDSVRGASQVLFSSLTNAEVTDAAGLTSFNSNGFSVGTNQINDNAATMVAWQWKESASAGFDIVTYTGDGTSSRNISHSLGVVPSMVIVKCRSSAYIWPVKHKSLASNNNVFLEQTTATTNVVSGTGSGGLGDLSSSTTFSVVAGTTNSNNTNQSAQTYVAYLFSEVAGFSKFGSYTGNGSTTGDGPFVYLGFRPRYVMLKNASVAATNWYVYDSARDTYNQMGVELYPNASSAEASRVALDFTANGFKIRSTAAGWDNNNSGNTIIYAAFAENPFRYSLAR